LLEELRRLRQGEELAGMGAARHQVVAGALGGGLGEDGGFDVQEAMGVQEVAQVAGDAAALAQALLHLGTAQIDIAVAQAQFLGGVAAMVVELDRRGLGAVENGQGAGQNLDLASRHVLVFGPFRARAHPPLDPEDKLAAGLLGQAEGLGIVRVDHHLNQTAAVTQVDEDDAAVIPAPVDPSAQGNVLTNLFAVQISAIMTAHALVLRCECPPRFRPRRPGKKDCKIPRGTGECKGGTLQRISQHS
jgi:hypothetical protein